jgi:dTDP-4-amino-4,6-dideoxygalactose transaminase
VPDIPLIDLRAQHERIRGEIAEATARVIERQVFVNGAETAAFEQEFAEFCELPECIAVASGTSALELALIALGIGPGDEVVTVSHTFFATVGAIARTGATPVFVDVDADSWTMSPELVERAVGPRTRAIVPVHIYGNAADVPAIAAAAPGIPIVEDAAQAHGTRYHGRSVGADAVAACFSFYPGKQLGAYGDAGAVATADPSLAEAIRSLRDHGRAGAKYEHATLGTNARADELQAAVLRAKLPHLRAWNAARQVVAATYEAELDGLGLRFQAVPSWAEHTRHLFVLLTEERDRLRALLGEQGIRSGVHYPIPAHRQPAMRGIAHRTPRGGLPVTDTVAAGCLSLPLYAELSDHAVDRVVRTLRQARAPLPEPAL